jgi:hypothetical protein
MVAIDVGSTDVGGGCSIDRECTKALMPQVTLNRSIASRVHCLGRLMALSERNTFGYRRFLCPGRLLGGCGVGGVFVCAFFVRVVGGVGLLIFFFFFFVFFFLLLVVSVFFFF